MGKRLILGLTLAADAGLLALGAALVRHGLKAPGLAILALTAGLTLLGLQALWPRFDLGRRSLRRGPRHGRAVALTFDDGPGQDTSAVLDALETAGARATFFVLGEAARRRPDLVRAIAGRGHEVALHGCTHARLAFAGPARIARELDGCVEAVRRAGVEPVPFFRAPHGWKGPLLTRALDARGLTLVGWTRGVFDSARPGTATIVARATRRMRPGEILLLHDGCGTPGIDPRRDQTAAAVPGIVERWRAAGYQFVTVSALGGLRGGTRLERLRGVLAPGDGRASARRRLLRAVGLLLVAAVVALGLRTLDLGSVGSALSRADPGLLLGAMGANVLSLAFHTLRFTALVPRGAARPRFRDAFAAVTAGFAVSIVVPARAGDVVRAWILARRTGLSTATVVAVAGFDYVVGAAAVVPLLAALALATPLPGWAGRALLVFATVAVLGGTAAAALRPRGGRTPTTPGTGRLSARLRGGLAATGDPGALALAFSFGLAGWTAEVLIARLALAALGLPAGLEASALAVLASTAAGVVAFSPGGAGTFELAIVLALSGVGLPREASLAFALLYHAVHLVPVGLMGSAALVREMREELA
ncbi:MAG TPA: lysylphosphatidylglycerol synthase domain-containing protein [Anaeromyxobacter sp.]|nr:lysylphosphatidylglycerol synthase domain-containing protein [Anaeromyxobacter sp.]